MAKRQVHLAATDGLFRSDGLRSVEAGRRVTQNSLDNARFEVAFDLGFVFRFDGLVRNSCGPGGKNVQMICGRRIRRAKSPFSKSAC